MNINMLCPMIDPDTKKMIFMDFSSGKTYELKIESSEIKLSEVSKDLSDSCFENVKEQQEAMVPEIPLEEIYEVLNTEKKVAEQNNKHIFRRGS